MDILFRSKRTANSSIQVALFPTMMMRKTKKKKAALITAILVIMIMILSPRSLKRSRWDRVYEARRISMRILHRT
jgi:hypothetical protein